MPKEVSDKLVVHFPLLDAAKISWRQSASRGAFGHRPPLQKRELAVGAYGAY
jgi:hypothetical protein